MPQTPMLKSAGLHTFNNYLSAIPEGSLLDANNVVITKEGVIEPRRGIVQYGTIGLSSLDKSKQLLVYKDRVLAHYNSVLAWDDGAGTFTPYDAEFIETEAGLRMKYIESNSNLYVTTQSGILKVATDSTANLGSAKISAAGAIKAITGIGRPVYGGPTFMGPFSKVAYRITWATTDINGNFIEGAASPAIGVINPSNQSAAVELTFQVPNGITTDYVYRIYRTNVATQSGTPTFDGLDNISAGDEMRLVIETPYVSGSTIIVTDATPEDFRDNGVNLYQNEISGEGVLQANEAPPFAKDIALYKNAVFYANTRTKHRLLINLLGLSGMQSFGGRYDNIDVTSITYLAPNTTITFSDDHMLTVGQRIVILGSGSSTLDGVQVVDTIPTSTSITVVADGTGATATNVSIYGSSVAVTYGTNPPNYYYFVGRPEVTQFDFPLPGALNTPTADYISMWSAENANQYIFWFQRRNVESTQITLPAPTLLPNSGAAAYISMWSANNLINYIFWFNQDTATAPVIPGATIVPVDINSAATSTDVAKALAAAIPPDFVVTPNPVTTNTIVVTNVTTGFTVDTTTNDSDIAVVTLTNGIDTTVAPSISGAILVEVNISNALTNNDVAEAFGDAVTNQTFDFVVESIVGATAIIRNANSGVATDATTSTVVITATKLQDGQGEDFPRAEITNFTLPAPASLNSAGTASYISVYTANDADQYIFWFQQGTAVAPVIPGAIIVPVDITAAVNAEDVAEALEAEVQAFPLDLSVSRVIDLVSISNSNKGPATDSSSNDGDIVVEKVQDGSSNTYVRLSTFDSPAQAIDDTARSLAKVITANPDEFINAFYIFRVDGLPGQLAFEARNLDVIPFTITANNSTIGALFNPNITNPVSSSNEERGNRIYYSKPSQPEAVPLVNFFDVGPKDKKILRIIALRDSLFILKEEGIYRLTGNTGVDYFVTLFDNSANLTAPDTAAVLNNQIYCLTSQGVCYISEAGVIIVSRQIEDVFLRISSPDYTSYKTASFGVSYESERTYTIWVPNRPTDTIATRAYHYNTFTKAWTYSSITDICAVVEPKINKLYLGAGDTNLIEVERKNLTRDDYADREYSLNIGTNAVDGLDLLLSSAQLAEKGDVLVQRQYVTISQVERLARKFATDIGVPNTVGNSNKDFYRNFDILPGANLQSRLADLLTQLNADTGESFNTTYSLDLVTFQTEYNAMIVTLNDSGALSQVDYSPSTGFIDFEMLIQSKNSTIEVTLLAQLPVIVGPVTLLKAIDSTVVWAPTTFGDPSVIKHIREGTIMFANAGIAFATIGYNSDLSPNFEDIDFLMEGDGSWGVFFYGSTTWGGEGTARPFRTLIPRQKQRCRFIRARFKHSTALYKFSILGLSYTYNPVGERGYK